MSLFSLDILEPSLTKRLQSSRIPLQTLSNTSTEASAIPSDQSRKSDEPGPPRWNTPEFWFYGFTFVTVVPAMLWCGYDVSREDNPNYKKYASLLSDGWIFGRKVDNSDAQYASFRDNIPILAVLIVLHVSLRRLFTAIYPPQTNPSALLSHRISFDLFFAFCFLLGVHGFNTIKILIILGLNYAIAKSLAGTKALPWATWLFNIGILFLNEWYDGYRFQHIHSLAAPLDAFGGIMHRWQILFNITTLRMISFNLDYYWSCHNGTTLEKKEADISSLSERDRIEYSCVKDDYSFLNYLAYVLYSPLYLAGPIVTFNYYISQLRYPSSTISTRRTILYGIRFLISLLTMEVILHYMYVVAISKTRAWEGATPFQLSMISYFNLQIIWLKLLLPWRFFRLWAMADGIETPENMLRCMSNNYSPLAFWRAWHRSFNRWIIRYIYIPLGGSKRTIINTLAVFTFVAFWHDISLKLLAWGWLVTLFILPEVIARMIMPPKKWNSWPGYRHVCAIASAGNILMLMIANLIGFCVGLDGIIDLLKGILGSYHGLAYVVAVFGALFIAVQVMFEIREDEKRRGINLRC